MPVEYNHYLRKQLRLLQRAVWLVIWASTDSIAKVLHIIAKYVAIVRRILRKHVISPIEKVASHALAKSRNLPLPDRHVISRVDISNDVGDGITLHSTLYLPVDPDHDCKYGTPRLEEQHKFSTILIRTPYGRANLGPLWAQIFAERGYAVVIQDTRGRFGSSGDFFPVANERDDGGETIEFIRSQPWCNGKIGLFGVSYLGLTTYAAAGSKHGHHVDCMVPVMTTARTHSLLYHNGTDCLALDLVLRWLWLAMKLLNTVHVVKFFTPEFLTTLAHRELHDSFLSAPLHETDEKLLGGKMDFLQEAIRATDVKHEFWNDKDVLMDMTKENRPPTHIVAGWQDFFCQGSFRDFQDAEKGRRTCKMTVGPWKHWDLQGYGSPSMKIALDMFDKHLLSDDKDLEAGVDDEEYAITVGVFGTKPMRWCGFNSWPPKVSNLCGYQLSKLIAAKPSHGKYSTNVFDPEHPTPYLGGPSFSLQNSGYRDQRSLEKRSDVLVFTSMPVHDTTYIVGDVYVELDAESDNGNTDFFFKLCIVDGKTGQSINLLENIYRMKPEMWDEQQVIGTTPTTFRVQSKRIKVGPVAAKFKQGDSIRLQISGGAHPLYMRNFGTGAPIAEATETRKQARKIYHSTSLLLPVVDKNDIDKHTERHPAFREHIATHEH